MRSLIGSLLALLILSCAKTPSEAERNPPIHSEGSPAGVGIDGIQYFVVEGDILMDEDERFLYEQARKNAGAPSGASPFIWGKTDANGDPVRWSEGKQLKYAVLRRTFRSETEYATVKDNFASAASAWERVCAIDFVHDSTLDQSKRGLPAGATFAVRGINAGGRFQAAAFFPDDPPERRKVLVDPSYFATKYDKTGIFRHEIGHILGFLHEHIRSGAPAVCPSEEGVNGFDYSAYDPTSVMHYFCGGVGSRELALSPLDEQTAESLYGSPQNPTMPRFVALID